VSARELFQGRKVDFNLDCQLEFGQYCQIHEDHEVTNTMKPRTVGAIALGPSGNIQGSYNFLNLSTWRVVKRRRWTALPIPQDVINMLNEKAVKEKIGVNRQPSFKLGSGDLPDEDVEGALDAVEETQEADAEEKMDVGIQEEHLHEQQPEGAPGNCDNEDPAIGEAIDVNVHETDQEEMGGDAIAAEYGRSDDVVEEGEHDEAAGDEPIPANDASGELEAIQQEHRYNLRPRRSNWKEKYAYAFTNISVKKGVQTIGEPAILSIMKEMNQLHEKKVFHPVSYGGLDRRMRGKLIRSHLFLKKKRDGRLKSRLVADGSMQERSSSVDTSSPTVSTDALFLSLAIDAHERRHVTTVDIEGAYLHADMTSDVVVELDPVLSAVLVQIDPSYVRFMTPREGKLYVKLDKALYGCVESAKLFYDHISKTLTDYGYRVNPYDPCVFNKEVYGAQSTVTIHVDDLKISCKDRRGVDDLIAHLMGVYKRLNAHEGPVLDYLGMDLDYSTAGVVLVSMKTMVEEAIEIYRVTGVAKTPAAAHLFQVSQGLPTIGEQEREKFHSMVQRLLYIAKRARPDILTAVSFLTTRVSNPTEEDNKKLIRVLSYLNGTRDLTLTISGSDGMFVLAFIDASHAVHPDGKGHSGSVITVGRGAVHCRSRKLKMVTKSSTESELVTLAEELAQVLWSRYFLEAQGYKMVPARVFQDNRSTIMLAEKGRSTSARTRHIAIRFFFVKDRIDSNEIKLEYLGTESMLADFFTKPLQGGLFERLRTAILGGDLDVIAGVCWTDSSALETDFRDER
jgi:hypothetical protein